MDTSTKFANGIAAIALLFAAWIGAYPFLLMMGLIPQPVKVFMDDLMFTRGHEVHRGL